jgi:hypothetical protein
MYRSSERRAIAKVATTSYDTPAGIEGPCEFDTHADTCVLGHNFRVLTSTNRSCNVTPFTSSYDPVMDVPIVHAATCFQNPLDGKNHILVINEGLFFGKTMPHSLLNPNQIRYNGHKVQDNPFDESPTAMVLYDSDDELVVPIVYEGTVAMFNSRSPTEKELNTLKHWHLTRKTPWNPQTVRLCSIESSELVPNDIHSWDIEPYDSINLADRFISEVLIHTHVRPDLPYRRGFQSTGRHFQIDAQELSNMWGIGLSTATQTLCATTQKGVRSAVLPLSRRLRTDRFWDKPRLQGKWYTDTVLGREKSITGNTCCQIFTNKNHFIVAYPIDSKAKAGDALSLFIQEYGVPESLTSDGSKEQTGPRTRFMELVRKFDIRHHTSEPYNPRSNAAEGVIREVRRRWYRVLRQQAVPRRLWDFGFKWVCEIMCRTTNSIFALGGRTPFEQVTGETPDISEYVDFQFYDYVWFKDNAGLGAPELGRWLGVSHRIGPAMSYFILKDNCTVISRTTVQRVPEIERTQPQNMTLMEAYNKQIARLIKDDQHILGGYDFGDPSAWKMMPDDDDPEYRDEVVMANDLRPEVDESFTPDMYDDTYLRREVALPRGPGEEPIVGRVTKRLRDANNLPIGLANELPTLDSRMYEVSLKMEQLRLSQRVCLPLWTMRGDDIC